MSTVAVLSTHELATELVPSPVTYRVLRPAAHVASAGDLPLLLFLHGGLASAEFLEAIAPTFEALWNDGKLPPMVAATPSAGRSFYLDRFDRTVLWEQFLLSELIPHLIETTGAGRGGEAVALAGVSMGGLGALRLAFRRPDRFVGVAAVAPAIEEATTWGDVLLRDRVYRDDELVRELFGNPVDPEHFHSNHPRVIAEANGHLIAAAGLDIYFECGDQDQLHLEYGSEALHRQLFAHGIDHEYRLVRGGNHVDLVQSDRFADALEFIGRSIVARDEPAREPDPVVEQFTALVSQQERDRGYRRTESLDDGRGGRLAVHVVGEGPSVVLIPSPGRSATSFDLVAARLARAGYQAIAPDLTMTDLTMTDLADDIASVIRALGKPATVVGHALGSDVGRMIATLPPDLVESVVLLDGDAGTEAPGEESSETTLAAFGPRATLVTIPGAGNALLSEQPAAVAVALLTGLARRHPR